jgi:hypothetical protein
LKSHEFIKESDGLKKAHSKLTNDL